MPSPRDAEAEPGLPSEEAARQLLGEEALEIGIHHVPSHEARHHPHSHRLPFGAKLVTAFAVVLGTGLVVTSHVSEGRFTKKSSSRNVDQEFPVEVESKAMEVDNMHNLPGYTEFAHVNCYENRGATSEGLSDVKVVVQKVEECAERCNMHVGECSGFVIFYRYFPFQCWLRSSIAKDKNFCQRGSEDQSQDVYHFSTYDKLDGVQTEAFPGTIQFQGKCVGVTQAASGNKVELLECGCSANRCLIYWDALRRDQWQTFRLTDFPSASVTSFRLKGTQMCLAVHDDASWRSQYGLNTKKNYVQISDCAGDATSRSKQEWIVLERRNKISFQLQWLMDPKLGLDVLGGSNQVGNHIQIYKILPDWPNQVLQNY